LDNVNDGNVTKDNFVNPPQKKFNVHYEQDYTEWGTEYAKDQYLAANPDLAILYANFDDYNGDLQYEFDDRETDDSETRNLQITHADEINESIKKSIKKTLKEQYSLFIKKHI
jgi:hypothetical protein